MTDMKHANLPAELPEDLTPVEGYNHIKELYRRVLLSSPVQVPNPIPEEEVTGDLQKQIDDLRDRLQGWVPPGHTTANHDHFGISTADDPPPPGRLSKDLANKVNQLESQLAMARSENDAILRTLQAMHPKHQVDNTMVIPMKEHVEEMNKVRQENGRLGLEIDRLCQTVAAWEERDESAEALNEGTDTLVSTLRKRVATLMNNPDAATEDILASLRTTISQRDTEAEKLTAQVGVVRRHNQELIGNLTTAKTAC